MEIRTATSEFWSELEVLQNSQENICDGVTF